MERDEGWRREGLVSMSKYNWTALFHTPKGNLSISLRMVSTTLPKTSGSKDQLETRVPPFQKVQLDDVKLTDLVRQVAGKKRNSKREICRLRLHLHGSKQAFKHKLQTNSGRCSSYFYISQNCLVLSASNHFKPLLTHLQTKIVFQASLCLMQFWFDGWFEGWFEGQLKPLQTK